MRKQHATSGSGKEMGKGFLQSLSRKTRVGCALRNFSAPESCLADYLDSASVPLGPGDVDILVQRKLTVLIRKQQYVVSEHHQEVAQFLAVSLVFRPTFVGKQIRTTP